MSAGFRSESGFTWRLARPLTAVPLPWLLFVCIGTPSITTSGNVPDVMEFTPRIFTVGVLPRMPEFRPTCTPADLPDICSRKLGVASCEMDEPFTDDMELDRFLLSCVP